jgi:DNA primase
MNSQDPVAVIKTRLNVEQVVGGYVQLKRAGRSLKGLCPFHQEKTPSFVVSPERQLAYCFGCNKGGDLFSFIQEIEGVDFKGAIEILAEKAGIDLSHYKGVSPEKSKATKDIKERLYGINEIAARFYRDLLISSKEGKKVLDYLEGRGFTAETIEAFQLGVSPDSFQATFEHLVQKNCSKKDLLEMGLLISKDTSLEKTYDRFRRRLMFPIWDGKGKVVGFGGRALKQGDEPKYLNSPESPIYHKGAVLYGFHKAKQAIREKDMVVVVEGYMDVMASHQAGVAHVVASSGTALTEAQLKLIKRFTKNIVFAFDTDQAGKDALKRAIDLGQKHEFNMKVIQVPQGKDPDECIKEDPNLWLEAIDEAPYYLDYYLQESESLFDITSMEGKGFASTFFLSFLKSATSIERDHYIKQLAFVLRSDPTFVFDAFNALKADPYSGTRLTKPKQAPSSRFEPSGEDYYLGLLLRFPESIDQEAFSNLEIIFEGREKAVYSGLSSQYNNGACVDVQVIFDQLNEEEVKYWEMVMLYVETKNSHLAKELIGDEILRVKVQFLKNVQKKQSEDLMYQIRLAQEANDAEQERKLFQDYSRLYGSN